MAKQRYDLALLIGSSIRTIRRVQHFIRKQVDSDPVDAFSPVRIGTRQKAAIAIDRDAQREAKKSFERALHTFNPLVIGEESPHEPQAPKPDKHSGLVILVDMIDGTDLLERGLSNWCSAVVMYTKRDGILASFVGIPEDGVYFATYADRHAFKYRNNSEPIAVHKPTGATRMPKWGGLSFDVDALDLDDARARLLSVRVPQSMPSDKQKSLEQASVCVNTQKRGHVEALAEVGPRVLNWLRQSGKAADQFRFYDLSGNPMLARLAEGRVDVVLTLKGSAPHDFVPGAFIARRAGASIMTLTRGARTLDLNRAVWRPATQYVAARTLTLASEIRQLLPDTSQLPPETID